MLYLYESNDDLWPLNMLRHDSEIFVGTMTIRARIERLVGKPATLISRAGDRVPGATESAKSAGLFMPGNVLAEDPIPLEGPEEVGVFEGAVVYQRLGLERAVAFDPADPEAASHDLPRREIEADFVRRPWDVIAYLSPFLHSDCDSATRKREYPNVVINEEKGSVHIGEGTVIEPFAYIVGPTWIGENVLVKAGAQIRESVIGDHCRVSGEISSTTFFPFSNKQHDGFIGNSVVASWVNIGAGATGSNLKNTYGEIAVDGEKTGLNYFGQIIGDHTKIGIGALMNTGSLYGICSSIVAGPGPLPKIIDDFRFGDDFAEIESVLKTIRIVMARRNRELSSAEENLIREYHAQSNRD